MQSSRIAEFTLAAGEYVRRSLGVELDGSVESLAYVDHYLSKVGDARDEVLPLIAAAIGAYFGEVLIAHFGGEWSEVGEPAEWTLTLAAAPISVHPIGMTAEALRQGEVDGFDASMEIPPRYQGAVTESFEAAGPVEESYYYSLTGRLESLEHAAEVIAEVRRQEEAEEERETQEAEGDQTAAAIDSAEVAEAAAPDAAPKTTGGSTGPKGPPN